MRLHQRIMMSNSLDRAFGERVLITPQARSTYLSPTDDGTGYEVFGIIMNASRTSQPRGDEALKGAKVWRRGNRFVMSVYEGQFDAADGRPMPVKGDSVTLLEYDDQPVFRVESVQPGLSGRVNIKLARIGE